MSDVKKIESYSYQFYKWFFKHRLVTKLPMPFYVYQQDNIIELCFEKDGNNLKLIMNVGYLREKRLPTTWVFVDGKCSSETDQDGDLMDDAFFRDVDLILEMF